MELLPTDLHLQFGLAGLSTAFHGLLPVNGRGSAGQT